MQVMKSPAINSKVSVSLLGATLLLSLAGCDESARRPVQVRPPENLLSIQQAIGPLPADPRRAGVVPLGLQRPNGVETLIKRVEAVFQSGEQNYKAGHLGKARRDFDQAVDWLLSSGLDLQADPRLEQLYDRIVDTVHGYEMMAFREGDGFSEQKAEPAPIDEIAELNVPPPDKLDPRLGERAAQELTAVAHDLPLTVNDYVLSYLNFFQTPRGRAIVEHGLRRSGRYRDMIARVLREEGMPQDPEKATRAAARHLRDLYQIFGDWYLAMAAYNSGPANVAHAIERTGYADFWELYKRNALPRETKNYVPIILALTLMSKDANRYGLQAEPEPPLRSAAVRPGHPIDLRLVAETIEVELDTLRTLNPQLLHMVSPADPEFELRLPEGTAERFYSEIAAIPPEKWVSWRRHRVEDGETLSAIANRYRVTASAIADANGLDGRTPVKVGDKLIIPAAARPQPTLGKLVRYRVHRGDTLDSFAEQFDASVADLKRWNGLRSNRVGRGTSLRVYPGGRTPPSNRKSRSKEVGTEKAPAGRGATAEIAATPAAENGGVVHRVKQGETLWSIALAYRTTVEALRSANRFLFSRQLQPGDLLMIRPPH